MSSFLKNWYKCRQQSGFTIVELLIVIVVIGILAALVLNAFTGAQDRARATKIHDDLQKIEKALKAWAIDEGFDGWPTESELGLGGNPTIASLAGAYPDTFAPYINETELGALSLDSVKAYRIDSDGDTASPSACGGSGGFNLLITQGAPEFGPVDEVIDDGDGGCGKVLTVASYLLYRVSRDPSRIQ